MPRAKTTMMRKTLNLRTINGRRAMDSYFTKSNIFLGRK